MATEESNTATLGRDRQEKLSEVASGLLEWEGDRRPGKSRESEKQSWSLVTSVGTLKRKKPIETLNATGANKGGTSQRARNPWSGHQHGTGHGRDH